MEGNKDIKVAIIEPATGEVVEQFNVYISAVVKYAKFRMQPSKGSIVSCPYGVNRC
jgi:hypothetical protein